MEKGEKMQMMDTSRYNVGKFGTNSASELMFRDGASLKSMIENTKVIY